MKEYLLLGLAVLAIAGAVGIGWAITNNGGQELLNVSNDPTRELWQDLNDAFVAHYARDSGTKLAIRQSHGGSASQARAVIDGLEADVVTLALWPDTDAICRKGLIQQEWEDRLPNHSLAYFSTIVFVVRKGNPKKVHDWADLAGDVKIITPNPKTSGNGNLSFLAAWGSVLHKGGTDAAARELVTALYQRVPVLDTGTRGATTTFAQKGIGDVHLTWESEGQLEVRDSKGELELVYPSVSIRAEPPVAVVDSVVDRKGTRAAAEAYLKFLWTDEGPEIFARHFYRPINKTVLQKHAAQFPDIQFVELTKVAKDRDDAQQKFFAEGGVFDQIYTRPR
jgi:sulfate transport system substrate-binding protein